MTREEVKLILDKSFEKDYTICKVRGRRNKIDLHILLWFMYYAHLKMVDALKLTPKQISKNGGWFYSDRYRKYMRFEIDPFFYSMLSLHILANEIKADECIIAVKKRALTYAFKQIALENGIENCRITDVLYAGERDNVDIRKPYAIDASEIELLEDKFLFENFV